MANVTIHACLILLRVLAVIIASINPGEACDYLTGKATIAIFDTQTLDVKIIPLE